jgi:hypothetical protein
VALLELNLQPSDRQLRQFGLLSLVLIPLIAWLWTASLTVLVWATGVGLILCGLGLWRPSLLKPVFLGLIILTLPIGLVVGELAMLLIYFGLFLPMAIVFRILGRDTLQRRPMPEKSTFWQPRPRPAGSRSYFRQF